MIERILNLLKQHNLSMYKVAKDCGFSQSQFSAWKTGTQPTIDAIEKLSDYLNVSTDLIIKGKEKISNLNFITSEIENYYNNLNFENKNKLLGYADGLLQNQKLTKKEKTN